MLRHLSYACTEDPFSVNTDYMKTLPQSAHFTENGICVFVYIQHRDIIKLRRFGIDLYDFGAGADVRIPHASIVALRADDQHGIRS